MTRWTFRLAPLALAIALILGFSPGSSLAQEPAPAQGEASEGRPLDGYFATSVLVAGALFVIAKSARR